MLNFCMSCITKVLKFLVFATLLVVMISYVNASQTINARMIEKNSEIYGLIDILYSLSGKAKANTNRPWTESQARLYLSQIDRESLPEKAKALYDNANAIINEGLKWNYDSGFGLSVGLTITPEVYAHSDRSFDTEEEWVRSWNDRKPLLRLWFEASSGSNFYTTADLLYRYGRASNKDEYAPLLDRATKDGYIGAYKIDESQVYVKSSNYLSSQFATNIFTDTINFSFIWPNKAIFSTGGDNWNLSFNRDRLKISDSHIGSLLVDDHTDYNDYFRLSFFNPMFNYDWILLSVNNLTSKSEDRPKEAKLFMIHTLDFRIFDKVSFKLSENVMMRYEILDLGFLNPSFFFHNLNNRSLFNALAYIEVEANLLKGFELYGQFALDQARAPNEGDEQASSYGFSTGLEYTFLTKHGAFETYAEFLYTSPLLYRRDDIDFIKASRYYHLDCPLGVNGHIPFFEYIGYRYGSDTMTLKVGSSYYIPEICKLSSYLQLFEHGQMSIYTSHNKDGNNEGYANILGTTPTGEVITRAFVLSLKAEGKLSKLFTCPNVTGVIEADLIASSLYNRMMKTYSNSRMDLQLSLGLSIAL